MLEIVSFERLGKCKMERKYIKKRHCCEKVAKREPKNARREPKESQRKPKGAKSEPKGSQRAPKWKQNPSKIHQNGSQNRHERQGRFWMAKMAPKRIQNGAKRHPKSMQNRCKNQCRKGIGKWSQNESKLMQKWCQNWYKICPFREIVILRNLAFTIVKARFTRFRGSKNRWEIDPKTMQKHESKSYAKMMSKWNQNGSKIDQKGDQKSMRKSMRKSMQNCTLKRRIGGRGVTPLRSTQSPYLVLVS